VNQLAKRLLHAFLDIIIGNDETTLLIATDQQDTLRRTNIELIEASQHMRKVQDRSALTVDLVEDVIAE
jgi:hypothetical protein